jgi:simple sugar transport system substrate-binding protein
LTNRFVVKKYQNQLDECASPNTEGNYMKVSRRSIALLTTPAIVAVTLTLSNASSAPAAGADWCSKVKISYFKGGSSDAFSDILEKGARAAAADTGAQVTIIGSGWDFPKMVQGFREEIAKKPDAISFMGHPGDGAIQPLAKDAKKAGILVDYANVPPAETLKNVGGGFVGANLRFMGEALATRSIKDFGLASGDEAIVVGTFGVPGRSDREDGSVAVLEKAGLKVNKLNLNTLGDTNGNPDLATASLTASIKKATKLKLIVAAGPVLGNMPNYFKAAGLKPGQVKVSGFDLGATVFAAFASGHVQLSADQEPFKQGYFPIVSLCMQKVYGLAPSSVDTSSGFVTTDNFKLVSSLPKGYR